MEWRLGTARIIVGFTVSNDVSWVNNQWIRTVYMSGQGAPSENVKILKASISVVGSKKSLLVRPVYINSISPEQCSRVMVENVLLQTSARVTFYLDKYTRLILFLTPILTILLILIRGSFGYNSMQGIVDYVRLSVVQRM